MRNKKITAALGALSLMLAALCGCSLAKPNSGPEAAQAGADRLVGVLITTDYLDLFDMDAYLQDHMGEIVDGGTVTVDGTDESYTDRLYAVLSPDDGEYHFPGVDGIRYFTAEVTNEYGTCSTSYGDEGISDGHIDIHSGDTEESVNLQGTVYITPSAAERVYYINPVFQSADGSIYVTPGGGFLGCAESGLGSLWSQTLDSTTTMMENGVETTVSGSVTISLNVMYKPTKIVILQMGGDSAVIARDEYAPGAVPVSVTPDDSTAYLVAETYSTDPDGTTQVTRTLYSPDDGTLTSFFCREDGICVKQYTEIRWN